MIKKTIATIVFSTVMSSAVFAEASVQPAGGNMFDHMRDKIAQDRDTQIMLATFAAGGALLLARPVYRGIKRAQRAIYKNRAKAAAGMSAAAFVALVYAAYKKGLINTTRAQALLEQSRQYLGTQATAAKDTVSSYAAQAGNYVWNGVKGGSQSVFDYFASLISHTEDTVPTGNGALDTHA